MQTVQSRAIRAHRGVGALFFLNAIAFASIVPRYVELRDRFGLGDVAFGLLIAAGPLGAISAGFVAARAVRRWGPRTVAVGASSLLGLNLILIAFAPSPVVIALAFFTAGVLDALGDIANNAYGLRVQRILGRSVISGLHGVWSIGAIVGGVLATAATAAGMPMATQLIITGILVVAIALGAGTLLTLPQADDRVRPDSIGSGASRPVFGILAAVIWIAVAGAALEDTVSTWGGVYIVDVAGVQAEWAGVAFIALMITLTIGRLIGDQLIDAWGPSRVAVVGSCLAAAGLVVVIVIPVLVACIVGFALVGLGIATLIPSAMHAADEIPGLAEGAGLAIASTVMRTGFLFAPVLIGFIADVSSLRAALIVGPVIALVTVGVLIVARPFRAASD